MHATKISCFSTCDYCYSILLDYPFHNIILLATMKVTVTFQAKGHVIIAINYLRNVNKQNNHVL